MRKSNQYLNIDKFKSNTLKYLALKKEEPKTYPINKSDLLILRRCPLCNSSDLTPIAEVYLKSKFKFFSTSTCNNCLFTFRPVSPSLKWFKKCWKKIASKKLEVFNPEVEKYRKKRYQKYYQLSSKYVKGKSMLDIGAGYGTGSKLFKDHGFDVDAVEAEINKINYIEKFFKIPVVSDSVEKFVSKKKNYDLIVFAACLEHLDNPVTVMSRLRNILNNETGILYLEVPIIWDFITWSDALYLSHKSNFIRENVTSLIIKSGFEVLEMIEVPSSPEKPWELNWILKPNKYKTDVKISFSKERKRDTLNKVRDLYRKDIPLSKTPPSHKVLKYSVPYIEQFFQVLNMESQEITENDSGFISFNRKLK